MSFQIVVERLSCRRFFSFAITLCALFFLFSPVVKAEFQLPGKTSFDQELVERSKAYLESIQNQVAKLPPEQRERRFSQAQEVVKKGFAKLQRPSKLIQKQIFDSVDRKTIFESIQKIDGWQNSPSVLKAAVFLGSNFHQPSELEVAVRVALPSRFHWEQRFGILAAHRPFSGSIFGFASPGCSDMIVVPATPRDGKTWAIALGRISRSILPIRCDNVTSRFLDDDNLLVGFPLIAQTIVLRI